MDIQNKVNLLLISRGVYKNPLSLHYNKKLSVSHNKILNRFNRMLNYNVYKNIC